MDLEKDNILTDDYYDVLIDEAGIDGQDFVSTDIFDGLSYANGASPKSVGGGGSSGSVGFDRQQSFGSAFNLGMLSFDGSQLPHASLGSDIPNAKSKSSSPSAPNDRTKSKQQQNVSAMNQQKEQDKQEQAHHAGEKHKIAYRRDSNKRSRKDTSSKTSTKSRFSGRKREHHNMNEKKRQQKIAQLIVNLKVTLDKYNFPCKTGKANVLQAAADALEQALSKSKNDDKNENATSENDGSGNSSAAMEIKSGKPGAKTARWAKIRQNRPK